VCHPGSHLELINDNKGISIVLPLLSPHIKFSKISFLLPLLDVLPRNNTIARKQVNCFNMIRELHPHFPHPHLPHHHPNL
jgi:hypothetical protein